MTLDTLLIVLHVLGLFAFAVSGAVAAIKRKADIIGVIILSLVASICGGICRDILIGDLPPEIMKTSLPLAMAVGTGLATYFFHGVIMRLTHPIEVFDAIGLGMYTVIGANKALAFGISPVWSIGMGVITAVGGGAIRDILLARVPTVLRSEIYIIPAFLGAAILVTGKLYYPAQANTFMVAGAIFCTALRLLALHYRWNMPRG